MRFIKVFALATAVTAVPLGVRSADPQLRDILGGLLSGVDGILGGLAGGILDLAGGILQVPLGIVGEIADRLDPREWIVLEEAVTTIKQVMEPHVPANKIATRSPDDPISDLLSNIPIVGGPVSSLTSGIFDAIGSILGVGTNIVGEIFGGLDRDEYRRVQQALTSVKVVFESHLEKSG
jgi:hypothetical protein